MPCPDPLRPAVVVLSPGPSWRARAWLGWRRTLASMTPDQRLLAILLGQFRQRSTIVATINAVVLLAGWHMTPDRLEALGTVLAVVDSIVLAAVQERGAAPGPAQTPDVQGDDECSQ